MISAGVTCDDSTGLKVNGCIAGIRCRSFLARSPVVQFPKDLASGDRTLRIARTDRKGDRREIKIDDSTAAAGFYDLAKINVRLIRGATYEASIGSHKLAFEVDAKAKSGPAPVVSRLLRFQ